MPEYKDLQQASKFDGDRKKLRFLFGFEVMELIPSHPDLTLLEFLRNDLKMTASKEGCAEGDCGACTIIIGELVEDRLHYSAVNSCIAFLAGLDGKQILTIEHLSIDGLHPAQQAMLDFNATQCGFCTPGFVATIATMQLNCSKLNDDSIIEALIGNLCRCTGYGTILNAAKQAIKIPPSQAWWAKIGEAHDIVRAWSQDERQLTLNYPKNDYIKIDDAVFIKPYRLEQAQQALQNYPNAQIYTGGTDVALWVTKMGHILQQIIALGDVKDLLEIHMNDDYISIGSSVGYERVLFLMEREYPALGSLMRRIGSWQVRSRGTLGGNIANGSPIGDSPPALMALGASISLLSSKGQTRKISLKDFFIAYGKQDLAEDEIITQIHLQRHQNGHYRCYKISKRFDQDITAILGCFYLEYDAAQTIQKIHCCFGGMAGIPAHAHHTEAALLGQKLSHRTIEKAKTALSKDFQPLSDMRASAEYRMLVAQNLLERFHSDIESENGLPLLETGNPFQSQFLTVSGS